MRGPSFLHPRSPHGRKPAAGTEVTDWPQTLRQIHRKICREEVIYVRIATALCLGVSQNRDRPGWGDICICIAIVGRELTRTAL